MSSVDLRRRSTCYRADMPSDCIIDLYLARIITPAFYLAALGPYITAYQTDPVAILQHRSALLHTSTRLQ